VTEITHVGTMSPATGKPFEVEGAVFTISNVERSRTSYNNKIQGDYVFISYSVDNTDGEEIVSLSIHSPSLEMPSGWGYRQMVDGDDYVLKGAQGVIVIQYTLSEFGSVKPNEDVKTPS